MGHHQHTLLSNLLNWIPLHPGELPHHLPMVHAGDAGAVQCHGQPRAAGPFPPLQAVLLAVLASACSVVRSGEAAWMCPAGNCSKHQLGAVGWGELQQVLVAPGAFPLGLHSAGGWFGSGHDPAAPHHCCSCRWLWLWSGDRACLAIPVTSWLWEGTAQDAQDGEGRREAVLGRHRSGLVLSLCICSFMAWVLARLELLSTETMGAGG